MSVQVKRFADRDELKAALFALLLEHMGREMDIPHAIMLPGGSTPFEMYSELAETNPAVDRGLHIILSDERAVAADSPESNYGRMRPLLTRAGLHDRQILHPDCALPLDEAACRYGQRLQEFFERGGRITLGLLGVGADGHTASLFTPADLENREYPYAIPVRRPSPPERISVTAELIARSDRIIFLCTGAAKSDIVAEIESGSEQIIAVRAVERVGDAQLWHSP